MRKVMVCGAGFMGSGIAQVCANAGFDVLMWDITAELAQRGKANIASGLEKQVIKGKMTSEQKEVLLSRLTPISDISKGADSDITIEAVLENINIKTALYKRIESVCRADSIIGTNTSYLPITKLAQVMEHPERFLGLHFFAPVYAMKLLEIIRGKKTSDATIETALNFAGEIKKTPVLINKDEPGFVVNRINKAVQLEALQLLHKGIASASDIDLAVKLGLNYPMGPFELMDFGGLDVTYACLNELMEITGDEKYKPVPELEAHIKAGEYGRKSGKGWYDYNMQGK